MRGLSDSFLQSLTSGLLSPLLNIVKLDDTLCLEIRDNAVNIYYRGGNLLQIQHKSNQFNAFFDRNYLNPAVTFIPNLPGFLQSDEEVKVWLNTIPYLKHEMDIWIGKNHKYEKEFQQLLLRENNNGDMATGTDYFICDLEYAAGENGRFDLIAVRWPSSSGERKKNTDLHLAFLEMKYMDKALTGKSGLRDHLKNMQGFLATTNLRDLKEEMKTVFNQKQALGLIRNQKQVESFSDDKPEYILVLANHDPDSAILWNELEALDIPNEFPAEVKIAVNNFMGYGLFSQNIYSIEDFKQRFDEQIFSKAKGSGKVI